MERLASIEKHWAAGDVCAALAGAIIELVLSNPGKNPLLNEMGQPRVVSEIAHYFFHPLTYLAVAVVFAFVVFRRRGVGLWSIFLSFIVGGLLASSFLALR